MSHREVPRWTSIPGPSSRCSSPAPIVGWTFGRDLAGWRPNGEVLDLRHQEGAVRFWAAGLDPIVAGPAFGTIEARNGQRIEIVLREARGALGPAQVFVTTTDRGPYGRFRGEWSVGVEIPEVRERTALAVRPFWEALGTVSRLRFDPPPGGAAIDAVAGRPSLRRRPRRESS